MSACKPKQWLFYHGLKYYRASLPLPRVTGGNIKYQGRNTIKQFKFIYYLEQTFYYCIFRNHLKLLETQWSALKYCMVNWVQLPVCLLFSHPLTVQCSSQNEEPRICHQIIWRRQNNLWSLLHEFELCIFSIMNGWCT